MGLICRKLGTLQRMSSRVLSSVTKNDRLVWPHLRLNWSLVSWQTEQRRKEGFWKVRCTGFLSEPENPDARATQRNAEKVKNIASFDFVSWTPFDFNDKPDKSINMGTFEPPYGPFRRRRDVERQEWWRFFLIVVEDDKSAKNPRMNKKTIASFLPTTALLRSIQTTIRASANNLYSPSSRWKEAKEEVVQGKGYVLSSLQPIKSSTTKSNNFLKSRTRHNTQSSSTRPPLRSYTRMCNHTASSPSPPSSTDSRSMVH